MNKRKIIGPVIIAVLIIIYYGVIGIVSLNFKLPLPLRIALLVLPLLVTGAMVYVLIERVKEIKSGEEDDLGKY